MVRKRVFKFHVTNVAYYIVVSSFILTTHDAHELRCKGGMVGYKLQSIELHGAYGIFDLQC
jgi:hypothetical protein